MRHEPTRSEWLLWQALKHRQLGVTFRRQVVLQGYIADLYTSSAKLIVEVDGDWHTSRRTDSRRDRVLSHAGYRILRVSSEAVVTALRSVLAQIRTAL
jgi:very-short-patch-repair endonuclease